MPAAIFFWSPPIVLEHDESVIKPLVAEVFQAEIEKMHIEGVIPPHVLISLCSNAQVKAYIEQLTRGMILRLTQSVASVASRDTKIEQRTEFIDLPADWWQHFRQRWFPKVILRRWPVITRKHMAIHSVTYLVTVTSLCPHVPIPKGEPRCLQWLADQSKRSAATAELNKEIEEQRRNGGRS